MQHITIDPNEPIECHGEILTSRDQECIEKNSSWRLIALDDHEVYGSADEEYAEEDVLWMKLSDKTIRILEAEGFIDLENADIIADETNQLFHENLIGVFRACKKSDVSGIHPGQSSGLNKDYTV